ncbi:MAG: cytochrome c biogenesis CcdA family protein [Ignavibacteriales bacterium]
MVRLTPEYFSGMSALAGIALAFLGGVLSSASPCVLAALPAACAVTSSAPVRRRVLVATAFTLGTTTSLAALGLLSVYIGRSLAFSMRGITIAFGGILIVAGLMMGGWLGSAGWDTCSLVRRRTNAPSAFLFGVLFGTVMTPCASPMLIAILGLLAAGAEPMRGLAYMLAYSLGHCILVFAASLSWAAVEHAMQKYAAGIQFARRAAGLLLCAAGLLLVYSAF